MRDMDEGWTMEDAHLASRRRKRGMCAVGEAWYARVRREVDGRLASSRRSRGGRGVIAAATDVGVKEQPHQFDVNLDEDFTKFGLLK